MNNFTIYTDASCSQKDQMSSCGYLIFKNEVQIKHEIILMDNMPKINLAEIKSVSFALQYIFDKEKENIGDINIKTDHIAIINDKQRQTKQNYKELNESIELLEQIGFKINIEHIKGHSGNKEHNMVDRSCKNFLREHLKTFKPEPTILKRMDL